MRRLVGITLLAGMGGSVLPFFLFTASGARAVSNLVLRGLFKTEGVSIGQVQGNLFNGCSLAEVELRQPARLPPGSRLGAAQLRISPLRWAGFRRPKVTAEWLRVQLGGDRSEGFVREALFLPPRRLLLRGLEVAAPSPLPTGGRIEVGEMEVLLPLAPKNIRRIRRGKLTGAGSEAVLISMALQGGIPVVDVYCRSLDIAEWRELFPEAPSLPRLAGELRDVQLYLRNPFSNPRLKGECRVERLDFNGATLMEGPATWEMAFSRQAAGLFEARGRLVLKAGRILLRHSVVQLEKSRIHFPGGSTPPTLELRGGATVGEVKIRFIAQGPLDRPDIRLTSQPPMKEEKLLFLLATGQRWKGLESSLAQGKISPDLTGEFLRYLLFGRVNGGLAQRWGLQALSPRVDPQKGVYGVKATLTDKVDARYEVAHPEDSAGQVTTSQRVGVEYRMQGDHSIGVDVERSAPAAPQESDEKAGEVRLKYKKAF